MPVVRVATTNNFNCTKPEWEQLTGFSHAYPQHNFFVNCNGRTPQLQTINDHEFKSVITANPDLIPDTIVEKAVNSVNPEKVAFIRVKWLPEHTDIQDLILRLRTRYQVVITSQRFNCLDTLTRYTDPAHYKWECNRFRLAGTALKILISFARKSKSHVCDQQGLGCLGCGLCATLNRCKSEQILSLNLSSSGLCSFHCPDCYAKAGQRFIKNAAPIEFDKIRANRKQSGRTKHIQNNREKDPLWKQTLNCSKNQSKTQKLKPPKQPTSSSKCGNI